MKTLNSQPQVIKFTSCLPRGQWFSPASSTTKAGCHDIAEILLTVALNTIRIQTILVIDLYELLMIYIGNPTT
jgi:hypothetical protein